MADGSIATLEAEQPSRDVPFARPAETLLDLLAADCPTLPLVLLSGVIGVGWCLWQFDLRFLAGTSDFWISSRGIRGVIGADIATSLSGYEFFIRDAWRLPLFHIDGLGGPGGANIIFTDSIPLLALAGRIVYRLTGAAINLFGLWTASCYVLTAAGLTGLLAVLGQRNVAAAATATIVGLSMPALLWRWGNPALMAHFEIVLALIFYFASRRRCTAGRCFAAAAVLLAAALLTNPYIFLMVGGIVMATIVQALIDRRLAARGFAFVMLGLAGCTIGLMLLCGHFETGAVSAGGFGFYSMNLLSPVSPQMSGLVPGRAKFYLDATGGQYEGFNYLGAGLLLLVAAASVSPARAGTTVFAWWRRGLRAGWTGHPCLMAVLCGFTALALSNLVLCGPWLVAAVPLPEPVAAALGTFRSSGRLFWPVGYAIAAVAMATAMRRYGRAGIALLIATALLQWLDAAPLRQAVRDAALPTPAAIDPAAWREAIARHQVVRVLPSFACLDHATAGWSEEMTIELQLLASLEGVPTNTIYAGRGSPDCAAEAGAAPPPSVPAGELDVYLPEAARFAAARQIAAQGGACRDAGRFVVCSREIAGQDGTALLAVGRSAAIAN